MKNRMVAILMTLTLLMTFPTFPNEWAELSHNL